ncbi:hypothetical protein [Roseospira navarrensis]|uniref:Antifreeze glycopeptide polyprotein n=1 Tax=Roseospira navarrensis TaxID=140058 RepID=A0A7X1ZBC6_9PROT|nr:hypothetical protein [Roseospira navarrensis]MQX34894.1 hypothetical protein [Roseospira navarrensis]
MIGSSAGRRVAGALALALAAPAFAPAFAPASAQAQQAPLDLLPPDMRSGPVPQPAPGPAPGPVFDPARPAAPPPLEAPREVAPPPGGLTESERTPAPALAPETETPARPAPSVEAVDGPLPGATGILTPQVGGFPADLWTGTPGDRAAALVRALPVGTTSPVMAELRRRLLLSEQRTPDGVSALDLLRARLAVLVAAGGTASEVMALADPVGRDATVDRLRLHALLVEADDARACALVRAVGARYPDAIWQQAAIHCDLLEDRRDAALLGLSMLREMGRGTDAEGWAFTLLAERLAGLDSPPPDRFAQATPVAWRLLRRLPDVDAPPDALDPAQPWTARALALAEDGGPPVLRAAAAERAAAAGALGVDTLARVWTTLSVDPRDLDTPLSRVVLGGSALDRAVAYAITARLTDPARLAEALIHPLETSHVTTPALYPTHARLYAPLVRRVPVNPRVPAFLGEAAGRALYVARSVEAGRTWLARLESQGRAGDLQSEEAAALLWPLARLADPAMGAAVPTERLLYWRQAQAARRGDSPEARRALDRDHVLLLNLFEALGADIGEAHWLPLRTNRVFVEAVSIEGGHTDPDRLAALAEAAPAGRLGEAVALALVALGPDGPAGASLETLTGVLRGLRALGLDDAARQLAVEALVARSAESS